MHKHTTCFSLLLLASLAMIAYPAATLHAQTNSTLTDRSVLQLPLSARPAIMSQLAKLTASDGVTNDQFSVSVAIDGDTVVVGSPVATVNGVSQAGAVYVFVKPDSGWGDLTQVAKLTTAEPSFFLGYAVAIHGDTIVAEAGTGMGAPAYVYIKPQTGWADMTQTAKLSTPGGFIGGGAPPSVVTDGNVVYLGAPWVEYHGNSFQGVVYLFAKPSGGWTDMNATSMFVPSDGGEYFGRCLGLSGKTVVVCGNGRLYFFHQPTNGWPKVATESGQISTSTGDGIDSVALVGSTLVAGTPYATENSLPLSGALYVFTKSQAEWKNGQHETAKLVASNPQSYAMMGYSVALSADGTAIFAGSPPFPPSHHMGSVYVYAKPADGWVNGTQHSILAAADGVQSDYFGYSVQISKHTLVVGAPQFTIGSGEAYIFAPIQ